ncbi:MAG TPA: GNAT family N-acetyltransferase [Pyrinomonadaceae bacterium]|nr:GNAT family N-acetyltransferase [Pyrinomonadaceae bacterium]
MIETERLKMRQLIQDDLPWLIEMRTRPEVYKYLGGTRMQNPEAITKRIEFYFECYEKLGMGQCVMIWKENGERIGCSGLQPLEDTGEIEVGYSLQPEFWRRGIGYECAMGWLDYGFNLLGLERIVAIANKENVGSWRIMEKCGMTYQGIEQHYGMPVVCYAISKAEFIGRGSKDEE